MFYQNTHIRNKKHFHIIISHISVFYNKKFVKKITKLCVKKLTRLLTISSFDDIIPCIEVFILIIIVIKEGLLKNE